jgi:hypothetical protein
MSEAEKIAAGLTEAQRADLTIHWDLLSDADPLPVEYDDYIQRMEQSGFMECVPVDAEALEASFAYERGIEPGGMMYRLTTLGLEVRAVLERQS